MQKTYLKQFKHFQWSVCNVALDPLMASLIAYNLHFKRVTPIALKSVFPSGPLKTKLIIINYSNNDKNPIYI